MEQAPFHLAASPLTQPATFYVDLHTDLQGWNPKIYQAVGPVIYGEWVDFIFHFKIATDNTGIYQFWIAKKGDPMTKDAPKVNRVGIQTWNPNFTGKMYPMAGQYRQNDPKTGLAYFDAIRIATTWEAANPRSWPTN